MTIINHGHKLIAFIYIAIAVGLHGCSKYHAGYDYTTGQDYSMRLTEAEVPFPALNPFAHKEAQREYLRFYRLAYINYANDPQLHFSSTISPISPQPEAAIQGHIDGQHDATNAKYGFWGLTVADTFGEGDPDKVSGTYNGK